MQPQVLTLTCCILFWISWMSILTIWAHMQVCCIYVKPFQSHIISSWKFDTQIYLLIYQRLKEHARRMLSWLVDCTFKEVYLWFVFHIWTNSSRKTHTWHNFPKPPISLYLTFLNPAFHLSPFIRLVYNIKGAANDRAIHGQMAMHLRILMHNHNFTWYI